MGDPFGCPTSFQWNGNSIVDYVVTTQSLFTQIITFKVGEYKPWISDHAALHYYFRIKMPSCERTDTSKLEKKAENTWHWDHDSSNKFGSCLKSKEISEKLTTISDTTNPEIMVTELTSTLHLAAKQCGLKMKRAPSTKQQQHAPWFDRDCAHLKSKMKKMAKNVKQYPQINKYKEVLYTTKKQFKNTVINPLNPGHFQLN